VSIRNSQHEKRNDQAKELTTFFKATSQTILDGNTFSQHFDRAQILP